ncbi:MAG: protelomerase family protein, partial [Planktothrix sp.]
MKFTSKTEMTLQIVEFIAAIKQAKSDNEIAEICNLECDRLRETYALTAFKRALSRYRNAIREDLEFSISKIPLSIMRLTQEESAKIERDYSLKVRQDRSNLIPIDPDKMILKGEELCTADGYLKNCLGLMLLTGRRNYEILKEGRFFAVRDIDKAIEYAKNTLSESTVNDCESILSHLAKLDCDNALLFVGQAKTSGTDSTVKQPYPIPVLSDADWILAIFNQFRTKLENGKKPTISELDYDAIHNRV